MFNRENQLSLEAVVQVPNEKCQLLAMGMLTLVEGHAHSMKLNLAPNVQNSIVVPAYTRKQSFYPVSKCLETFS